jgi:2-polyprenyl-3-methyl-5-hydroxy-6-metoxy-1,4-benzoquinol methylase
MLTVDAYREDLAYIHDVGHGAIARDAAERLIAELAVARHPSGTVVDLGCGSGILAGALVEAGYQVVGIDMSDAMVALARARAPNAEFHVSVATLPDGGRPFPHHAIRWTRPSGPHVA